MKITILTILFILVSCRPENEPTTFNQTIQPLAGPDKTIQTPMNTPINFTYSLQKDRESINRKVRIAKPPKNGNIYSCQQTAESISCVYEPNTNFVGTDTIEFVTVDGDFKAGKNSLLNIIVTYQSGGTITNPGDDLPDDFNTNIDDANQTCNQARQSGSIQTATQTISFPAAIECDFNDEGEGFNEAGNGPRQNGRVRARREQFVEYMLPNKGTICDIDFNFPTQIMEYDDEIFLLLNNYVLFSSTNYSDQSGDSRYENGLKTNSIGFQSYKWSGQNGLYDLYYAHNVTPRYCLGLTSSHPDYNELCFVPRTETEGQIKLDIPPSQIINLGLASQIDYASAPRPVFNFGFVSTGDNDSGDCEHSSFSFQIEVKYVPNN